MVNTLSELHTAHPDLYLRANSLTTSLEKVKAR